MIKTTNKSNLWNKGFHFILYFQVTVPHWGTSKQEFETAEDWNRSHRGMLFTGLLLIICSVCFLIPPRSSTTHTDLGLPHQLSIKKWPTLAYRTTGIFSIKIPSSKMTLGCVKKTHKLASTNRDRVHSIQCYWLTLEHHTNYIIHYYVSKKAWNFYNAFHHESDSSCFIKL